MLRIVAVLLGSLALLGPMPVSAQGLQLLDSYIARISPRDHYNSNGQRLWSAAAIIRQDRAHFHRFGLGDPEDQADSFFQSLGNRAQLESLLERGTADPSALNAIVHGTPLIRVDIYGYGSIGRSVVVTVLSGG